MFTIRTPFLRHGLLGGLGLVLLMSLWPGDSQAIPAFARKYDLSCAACHAAYPRLNEFGQQFMDSNYRLPNWKDGTISGGDDMMALPKSVPLALRAQAFVQTRDAKAIDVNSGEETTANPDIQAPYLIKLLSGAPLSDHVSYYFYGILAEKGGNGSVIVEDAWFSHDDLFDTGIGMMLGQYQISDLMFPRELRMTFQDYMVYRMAGLTYDRGIQFSRAFGPVSVDLGWANGNGIEDNYGINSPGYKRPDHLFDDNSGKSLYGRLGFDLAVMNVGLFGYSGTQKNAISGSTSRGPRDTPKIAYGVDASGKIGDKTWWFAQGIWNRWEDFINVGTTYEWFGAFVGVDYVHSPRWTFSALYNFADAQDLNNTDTVFEGIDINTLTLTASYYFMRNVKGVLEVNGDFQETEQKTGILYTGHLTKENYALIGFDAAF